MLYRLLLVAIILLGPIASHAQVEVFVSDTLDELSCFTPHFLYQVFPQTHEHTIRLLSPDSLMDSLAFTISVQSDNPDYPLSLVELEILPDVQSWMIPYINYRDTLNGFVVYVSLSDLFASTDTLDICRVVVERPATGWFLDPGMSICVDTSRWGDYALFMQYAETPGVEFHLPPCSEGIFVPNCGPQPSNIPIELANGEFCDPIQYLLTVNDGCAGGVRFEVASGPGEILYNTTYFFQPGPEDAGQTRAVYLNLYDDICGDGSFARWIPIQVGPDSFLVTVADHIESPSFSSGQQTEYAAQTGIPLEIQLQVDDIDPCNLTYSWYQHPQDPVPPCSIDSTTGLLTYLGTSADTGAHFVYTVVDEAGAADTQLVIIRHWESVLCGDMNHNSKRNLTDLTLLVNYLFLEGVPPVPEAAGDVNCSGGINLTDLTNFVNFLFLQAPDPCTACP